MKEIPLDKYSLLSLPFLLLFRDSFGLYPQQILKNMKKDTDDFIQWFRFLKQWKENEGDDISDFSLGRLAAGIREKLATQPTKKEKGEKREGTPLQHYCGDLDCPCTVDPVTMHCCSKAIHECNHPAPKPLKKIEKLTLGLMESFDPSPGSRTLVLLRYGEKINEIIQHITQLENQL